MQCWAVDLNAHACESLRKNHPNTEVLLNLLVNLDQFID